MKQTAIERLLPHVLREGSRGEANPLRAVLEVMEALHEPSEAALARLDATLDPRRTADEFVPYLACWVDLEPLFDRGLADRAAPASREPLLTERGRLRELIAAAAYLSQWRGTSKGLLLFLEIATGLRGFGIEERVAGSDGRPRSYHIRVRAPRSAEQERGLIERIVDLEKPAHVTYELVFDEQT
jgi:phage tail-like protein